MPDLSRSGIGNCLGSKSPTVRLQISRPPAMSPRMSPAIFRISEPISAPAIAPTRSLGSVPRSRAREVRSTVSRFIVARTMTARAAIAKGVEVVSGKRCPRSRPQALGSCSRVQLFRSGFG